MYYDNQNPFARDFYSHLMCKDAKRAFSRFHFGLFAYIAIAYVITIVADVAMLIVFNDGYASISENIYYQWIMGVLPMYAIGLPILYAIVRSMPTAKLQTSRLGLGEFLILFAIAKALMMIGNSIGTTLNSFFAAIKGDEISNSTSELIESSPLWITLIVAVIIGPIVEEFIFRKLMIERLARYGAATAIFVSGFSFGLFHGNLYQFFYAAMLGILLAYITVKTGNWLYSVVMHVLINFFGSVAILPIADMMEELAAQLEVLETGGSVNTNRILVCGLAVSSYVVFEYALVIAGIVLLILALKNRWYTLRNTAEVNIPCNDVFSVAFFNAGTIIFTLLSILLFAVSIILG